MGWAVALILFVLMILDKRERHRERQKELEQERTALPRMTQAQADLLRQIALDHYVEGQMAERGRAFEEAARHDELALLYAPENTDTTQYDNALESVLRFLGERGWRDEDR